MLPGITYTRRILPFQEWPEADRRAWVEAHRPSDPFQEGGAAAHLRPTTQKLRRTAYGRWLGFLVANDLVREDQKPEDRLTPETLAMYIAMLREQISPVSVWSNINALHLAFRAIAPGAYHSHIRKVANRLGRQRGPGKRLGSRIRSSSRLFEQALAYLDGVESAPVRYALDRSVHFRDGLMFALLAARPLRTRSLAALRIGRNLVPTKDGGFLLTLYPEDLKVGGPLELTVPERLVPYLKRYLSHHRPRLLKDRRSDALWITHRREPMTTSGVTLRAIQATPRIFGERMYPHLFRHCAATSWAIEDPEGCRYIAPLLGHGTQRTAELHYNKARALSAGRNYAELLERRRKRLRAESHALEHDRTR